MERDNQRRDEKLAITFGHKTMTRPELTCRVVITWDGPPTLRDKIAHWLRLVAWMYAPWIQSARRLPPA